MNSLQRFCATAALMLSLSFPTFAGDILCPGMTSSPSQTTSTGETQFPGVTATGQMDTPLASETDSVTDIALTLLVGALSIF